MTIVNRFILKDLVAPFAISIIFLTFVFMMTKILDITNYIVNYKISIVTVGMMLAYAMPHFLEFVIPMSVMMAVLLTFLRMSNDNEIIALKAGGVTIYRLVYPVLVFCLMGCLLTGFMTIHAVPWGRYSLRGMIHEIAAANIDVGLKERAFNDAFKGIVFYVNKVDLKNRVLKDVFIEDRRNKNIVSTVVSPKGRFIRDPGKQSARLRLYNGIINQANIGKRSVHSINFDTYDFRLDLEKAFDRERKKPKKVKEMTFLELRKYIQGFSGKDNPDYKALLVYHWKFSIPFACIALGILAVPLGIQSRSAKRSFGLGLGLLLFLVYYLLLSAGLVFGEAGAYPPVIGMWAPNFIVGGIGIYLLVRTANERSIKIDAIIFYLRQRFGKGTESENT